MGTRANRYRADTSRAMARAGKSLRDEARRGGREDRRRDPRQIGDLPRLAAVEPEPYDLGDLVAADPEPYDDEPA